MRQSIFDAPDDQPDTEGDQDDIVNYLEVDTQIVGTEGIDMDRGKQCNNEIQRQDGQRRNRSPGQMNQRQGQEGQTDRQRDSLFAQSVNNARGAEVILSHNTKILLSAIGLIKNVESLVSEIDATKTILAARKIY